MQNFTHYLTNGIYLPPYRLNMDYNDELLKYLGEYLMEFINIDDVRRKIKFDFELD